MAREYDYAAITALGLNYANRSVYLSGFSYGLLLTILANSLRRSQWHVGQELPTDAQWDEIDEALARTVHELMTPIDIGTVVALMTDTIPERYLLCDGGIYNREDYPLLYAVLPTSLHTDPDTFTLPDMSGLAAVGATISRPLLTIFGEETHTLTEAEMPLHTHSEYAPTVSATLEGVGAPLPTAGIPLFPTPTGTAGLSQAHNNMQPSISLYWCIVAK